jgi:hypothetical protein
VAEAREAVARQQSAALEAIFQNDADSKVIVSKWLGVAHEALERKRAWACSFAWPTTARSLGIDEYIRLFTRYVERHPHPPAGGAVVEGRLFARELDRWGLLPDFGKIQSLSFDLRYQIRNDRMRPRRGLKAAYRLLRRPPYLVLGLKLPLRSSPLVWKIRLTRRAMSSR